MIKRLNKYAGKLYLEAVCATNYPEQEPQYKRAKASDLLYLMIPIIGIIFFLVTIEGRK